MHYIHTTLNITYKPKNVSIYLQVYQTYLQKFTMKYSEFIIKTRKFKNQ